MKINESRGHIEQLVQSNKVVNIEITSQVDEIIQDKMIDEIEQIETGIDEDIKVIEPNYKMKKSKSHTDFKRDITLGNMQDFWEAS